jgi:hypothetical protein
LRRTEQIETRPRAFPGQWEPALLQDATLAGPPRRRFGRIAQLVEQLTLNQRVPGSSPGAPTNQIKDLAEIPQTERALETGFGHAFGHSARRTLENPPAASVTG